MFVYSWTRRFVRCLTIATPIALGLAGCHANTRRTTPPPASTGNATWQAVNATGTVHYQLAMGEVASGGTAFARVSPIYPPGLLASCPPAVSVRALLVVDGKGQVGEVRVAGEPEAGAQRRMFIDAVRVAALKWRFNPLQINHWAADANGVSHVVDSETKPFSQAYLFHFVCHAGKAGVSTDAMAGTGH